MTSDLTMKHGYFIIGTGTDVGKTAVACALLHKWKAQGKTVEAIKPLMSGGDGDAQELLSAMEREITEQNIAAVSPWRYAAPIAPHLAAAREQAEIKQEDVMRFCHLEMEKSQADYFLIEGAGGAMSPLDGKGHTMLDWMAVMALPVILVANNVLGSISHGLTALLALQSRGLRVAAVIVSESRTDTGMSAEATAKELYAHGVDAIPIGLLPHLPEGKDKWNTAPDLTFLLS